MTDPDMLVLYIHPAAFKNIKHLIEAGTQYQVIRYPDDAQSGENDDGMVTEGYFVGLKEGYL